MNLPFISQKKEEKQFLLSILLKPYRIGALLFEEADKKLTILSTKEENQEKDIESLTPEELVVATDSVISFVEGGLPTGGTVSNALFAVPYDWVEDGRIKRDYLLKLKKLCDDLALSPIGFIVSVEAIVAFLQNQAGVPLSSILVEVAKDKVFIYIVRAGAIIEVFHDDVGESVVDAVEKLLKGVSSIEVLPSKIVLFDHEGVATLQQEFLSHHWMQSLPFLHLPQVVILEKGFENEAIVNGVASQMGFDVLEDIHPHAREASIDETQEEAVTGEEFGFVKDQDIAHISKERVEPEEVKVHHHDAHVRALPEETEDALEQSAASPSAGIGSFFKTMIFKVQQGTSSSSFPAIKIPFGGGLLFFVILAVFGVLSLGYLYYSYILKSDIIVFADKKTFNKDVSVTFSSIDPTSPEKNLIHMDITEEKVDRDVSSETTGKKDTGEKAKGEVTLYNKTENKKTFTKGVTIVGANNLEFKLLDDATVASTSAFSTNFSSVKVKIEAAKFGQEYNLPSSTNFTIRDTSSSQFFAKNESALSGGTKKTVQVVDKKDLDGLVSSIQDEVKGKALSQVSSKIGSEGIVITTPLNSKFVEKTFDKKEGEESKTVSLSATISFKIASYKKSEIDSFVRQLAKNEIASNYSLIDSESKKEIKDVKVDKDNTVNSTLHASSVYVANVDIEKLKKDITGKSTSDAQSRIQKIAGVTDSHIEFKNKIPFLPDLLPMKSNHITITVKTNE